MTTTRFFLSILVFCFIPAIVGCDTKVQEKYNPLAVRDNIKTVSMTSSVEKMAQEWVDVRMREITAACNENKKDRFDRCIEDEFDAVERETAEIRNMAVYGPKSKTYPDAWIQELKDRVIIREGVVPSYPECIHKADLDEKARLHCALTERAWVEKHYQDLLSGHWNNTQTLMQIPAASTQDYEKERGE